MLSCVRACVRVLVCTCACCACVSARAFVCARARAFTSVRVCACLCACVRTCVRVCVRASCVCARLCYRQREGRSFSPAGGGQRPPVKIIIDWSPLAVVEAVVAARRPGLVGRATSIHVPVQRGVSNSPYGTRCEHRRSETGLCGPRVSIECATTTAEEEQQATQVRTRCKSATREWRQQEHEGTAFYPALAHATTTDGEESPGRRGLHARRERARGRIGRCNLCAERTSESGHLRLALPHTV